MKVYLIIYMGAVDYPSDVLKDLELIPESKLVETVKQMIENEQIDPELITDGEYDTENLTGATAIELLKDDGWTVKEYNI